MKSNPQAAPMDHIDRRSDGKSNSTTIPSGSCGPHNRKQLQDSNPIENPKKDSAETESRLVCGNKLQNHDGTEGKCHGFQMKLFKAQWDAIYNFFFEDIMNAEDEIDELLRGTKYEGWDEERGKKARDIVRKVGNFDIQISEYQKNPKVVEAQNTFDVHSIALKKNYANHNIKRAIRK
ncbi:hypothetical protein BTUL_0035g00570 [Botrytis tulipae]|uniref:Uncharacterized protein n=1 Tax=Botrytis tulipae TaxID=87230 RepID=A0A4Z1F2W4_9HELO|nr:hypothetical protein BTUL_0035g00570 [Botrytis tulipae]